MQAEWYQEVIMALTPDQALDEARHEQRSKSRVIFYVAAQALSGSAARGYTPAMVAAALDIGEHLVDQFKQRYGSFPEL